MDTEENVRIHSDIDYRREIYQLVYNTVTSKSLDLNVDMVGDYLRIARIRDAVLHTLFSNPEDRQLFFDWFDDNKSELSKLNEEYKTYYLCLMVGALFLDGKSEIAYNTGKLAIAYGEASGVSYNLAKLIVGAIDQMGRETALELFTKSMKALTLDSTLSN